MAHGQDWHLSHVCAPQEITERRTVAADEPKLTQCLKIRTTKAARLTIHHVADIPSLLPASSKGIPMGAMDGITRLDEIGAAVQKDGRWSAPNLAM